MFLASASTKRPIAMTCLIIALIAMGLNSYRELSLEQMPSVDIPFATVMTTWVGASPEDIEKDVTKRIEDAVSGIDGLKTTQSSSMQNVSLITMEFNLGVDIDIAAQDIREKVDGILADLPKDADRPVIKKVDINAQPIITLFLTGSAPVDDLYDYADNHLSDHFATVQGVGEVQVIGGNEREVWVELDREKLSAAGLTSMDVCAAIQGGVLNLPSGNVRQRGDEISVRFDAEYKSIADIGSIEVANNKGMRLKLRDLGTVRQATKEVRERAFLDGSQQGVVLKIVKKGEANTVKVVQETRKRFEELSKTLPGGMKLQWIADDAEKVIGMVDSTMSSIYESIIICAVILFLFLFNLRITIIVGITMPITMVISVFFLYVFHQSLNISTLMAIGLSTGVLVSNSIVVLENIVSKLDTMDDPWQAAYEGTSEMTVAVLASAGTNVVVMFPIALMTSLVGRFLVPFAVATLIVNGVSIFISFTLTPMLAALLLKPGRLQNHGLLWRLSKKVNAGIHRTGAGLTACLRFFAQSRIVNLLIVLGFAALFVFSMKYCGPRLGSNFIENEDHGWLSVRIELPSYSDLENTVKRVKSMERRIAALPGTDHTLITVGNIMAATGQASRGVYLGQVEVFLVSKFKRNFSMLGRCTEIHKLLKDETDCRISAGVANPIGNRSYGMEYQLIGDDLDQIASASDKAVKFGATIPGVDSIESTVREPKPEIRVVPKRAVLSDLKVQPALLAKLVRANLDGLQVADYRKGDRTHKIRVKLRELPGKEQIGQFLLPGAPGKPIPLETVADVVESKTTLQIYRYNKTRGAKILGDLYPGVPMTDVGNAFVKGVAERHILPAGYQLKIGGYGTYLEEAVVDFVEAIAVAAFLTLLTMCAILESWTRPFIVLLTLPMGLIGVVWALLWRKCSVNILVLLGVLMLIGIVVNAAILIVDKLGQLIKQGMPRRDAYWAAMIDQFRPVLMVVLASGLGMLPMAYDTGVGCENRVGMGVASVGGVIVAGVFTIFVLPFFYTLFCRKSRAQGKK